MGRVNYVKFDKKTERKKVNSEGKVKSEFSKFKKDEEDFVRGKIPPYVEVKTHLFSDGVEVVVKEKEYKKENSFEVL